jgi:hypothetical protein
MKFLNLLKKNKINLFSFEVEFDTSNFNTLPINSSTEHIIKDGHNMLKNTIDKHIMFLRKHYPKELKKDNKLIEKSCLELSAIYYYFFVQDFSENNISNEIGQYYFMPIFYNFKNLEVEINNNGFDNLGDFLNKKAGYFHEVLNNTNDMHPAYYHKIFVLTPLVDTHPFKPSFLETDISKLMIFSKYYAELIQAISKESSEFVKK